MSDFSHQDQVSRNSTRSLSSRLVRWLYGIATPRLRHKIAGFPGALWFYKRRIKPLLFPAGSEDGLSKVTFPNFSMYVDPRDTVGEMATGTDWEAVTSYIFRRVIQPGDLVIDIGAHWGYFTLLAATLCADAGKVFAFEPHPRNFAMLARNISANRLTNVEAIQKAVSSAPGEVPLFEARTSMSHSLRPLPEGVKVAEDAAPKTIATSAIKLDDFWPADRPAPRLIKMDIEGAEPSALEGMQALLRRSGELVLITEFNYQFLDSDAAHGFIDALAGLGFKTAVIDEEAQEIRVSSPEEILQQFLAPETRQVINLLCVRGTELVGKLLGERRFRLRDR